MRRKKHFRQIQMWYLADKASEDEVIYYALRKLWVDADGKGRRGSGVIQDETRKDYRRLADRVAQMLIQRKPT